MTARRIGSADVARSALDDALPLTVVVQSNAGRFEARRAGIARAQTELVLLLDGRVRLRPQSLAFAHRRVAEGETVWNGHVHVEASGQPVRRVFERARGARLARVLRRSPNDELRGRRVRPLPEGDDVFPGAPRAPPVARWRRSRATTTDRRFANDDTPVLRWIAERERIHLSPSFACDYRPRSSLGSFLRHSFHRGTVFLDGHGRPRVAVLPGGPRVLPRRAQGWRSWRHAGRRSCLRSDWASLQPRRVRRT